jgi:hypothetical protein
MTTSYDVVKLTQEGYKLLYDTFKHVTTLSTASILILATILDKLVKNPQSSYLIPLTFGAFFLSLVGCVGAMLSLSKFTGEIAHIDMSIDANEVWILKNAKFRESRFTQWSFFLGIVGFLVGIGSLVVFVLKNT